MARTVHGTVTASEENDKREVVTKIKGRMLGACSIMEATKIAQNWEVAKKVHTGEGASLADTIEGLISLEREEKDKFSDGFGHIVMALTGAKPAHIKDDYRDAATRMLYISPVISYISQFHDDKDGTELQMECVDGTMLVMEENKTNEE